LERLLGLTRFKQTRVDWIVEDIKEFFPCVEVYWYPDRENSFASMVVSRVPIEAHLPEGIMSTKERIAGMKSGSPRIGMFQMWRIPSGPDLQKAFDGAVPFFADSVNYDERFLSAYLALLAQGQISPHNLPPLKEDKETD
jgi:hypothetical protein